MQISFLLPIRNEAKTISSTLNAILNQVLNYNYEILIVDGGSTDGTLKIVNNYISDNPNIRLVHNPKKFVSSGFNLALNDAKGNIINRVDGHCELPPNYLEKCLELLESKDTDIVGGVIETLSTGNIGKAIAIAQSSWFGVGGVKFRNSEYKKSANVDTLAFGAHKREIFSEIGGYDEEMIYNQDDEFNFRAIQAGKKIWMDPTIKIKYYSRSNFVQLFKQYFNYGCYKVRGIQKRQQIIALRHLVPAVFVSGLFFTLCLGYLMSQPWISCSVLFIYIIINILFSMILSPQISSIPLIFLSFWFLHLGYGLGFIWGLIRFMGKWGDTALKDDHFNKEQFLSNSPVSPV